MADILVLKYYFKNNKMKLDVKNTAAEIARVALKDLSAYGSFVFYFIVIVAFLTVGDYAFFYSLLISLVVVTALVAILRVAYFKPRPGMKKKEYRTIYERIDNSSFPSIHAARSVLISMALFVKLPPLLPVFIALVLAVCASRIVFKRHDITDILIGLLIGFALGWLFFIFL